jgi:hypothetical protein
LKRIRENRPHTTRTRAARGQNRFLTYTTVRDFRQKNAFALKAGQSFRVIGIAELRRADRPPVYIVTGHVAH